MEYTTSTMICIHTPKERVMELVDYYTLKGEIVLLSCFNILDNPLTMDDLYIDMDKEKINLSDKLIVIGEVSSADTYAHTLVEYTKNCGKSIQYVS